MYDYERTTGSGKSTYILENYPESTPVSADFFFDELAERQGKTYTEVFDPSLLYEAPTVLA